jgi:hypothetical protein
MYLIMFLFDGGLLILLIVGLFKLIGIIIKNKWPSLHSKLINKKKYIMIGWSICFVPLYLFCVYMVWALIWGSPFYLPVIAKSYITKDLKKCYKANVKVIKIKKVTEKGIEAKVKIGNCKNFFTASYGLSNFGLSLKYGDNDIDDFYVSQKLTKILRDETGYKTILCHVGQCRLSYPYYYYQDVGLKKLINDYRIKASLKLVEPNADLKSILLDFQISVYMDIYDFYEGTINYDRLYCLITKLRKFNFKYLSIDYIQYDPEKLLYVTNRINRNLQIYDRNREVNWELQILFTLKDVDNIRSANELKIFIENDIKDKTRRHKKAKELDKRIKEHRRKKKK